MPYVDKRTGEIVIRIVYDGAAEAGKTTNIVQLSSQISLQRRGAQKSPGTKRDSRRTEFFDWLDFSGGFMDGRRVRCQLVSVPGQPELLHRRRYLLDAADAIVYVADARSDYLEEARRNIAITERLLGARSAEFPVGMIVQANKQDLPGALRADDLARELGLSAGTSVVESVAARGDGVMQTFILAGRLATERVRSMVEQIVDSETPDTLYSALLMLDEALTAKDGAEHAVEEELPMPPVSLPAGLEVSAGHVWPPVRGRALLAHANLAGLRRVPPSAWAPESSFELRADEGWTLHSGPRWVFENEVDAKVALLTLVRRQLAWSEFLPESRALFLAADAGAWRIWMLTAKVETLGKALTRASGRSAEQLMATAKAFWERLSAAGRDLPFRMDLDALGIADGQVAMLALDEGLGPSLATGAP